MYKLKKPNFNLFVGDATCFAEALGSTKFECNNTAVCLGSTGANDKLCDGNNDCGGSSFFDELGCTFLTLFI